MNQAPTIQNAAAPVAPSKQSLLKATGVALVVAIIVLTTAVLPAEYGIDPLGTGKALGLSGISGAAAPTVIPKAAAAEIGRAHV